MGPLQWVAAPIGLAVSVAAAVLLALAVRRMVRVIRLGQPDPERFTGKGARLRVMLTETLGHTRMLKWSLVGTAHWFVMVAFILLSSLVLEAYWEVFTPTGELPWLGGWVGFGLITEVISVLGIPAILVLITIRLANRPRR